MVASAARVAAPGSGSPEHVEQNVRAARLALTPDEVTAITDSRG